MNATNVFEDEAMTENSNYDAVYRAAVLRSARYSHLLHPSKSHHDVCADGLSITWWQQTLQRYDGRGKLVFVIDIGLKSPAQIELIRLHDEERAKNQYPVRQAKNDIAS